MQYEKCQYRNRAEEQRYRGIGHGDGGDVGDKERYHEIERLHVAYLPLPHKPQHPENEEVYQYRSDK